MGDASRIVDIGAGRQVAIGEFGDPLGAPVVFCHGSLGSWRYRHPDDAIATKVGVRLVTAARPGYGPSSRRAGRTVADWADDVASIADQLGIDRFAVLGHSGGGPHALACAARLPDRVTAVVVDGSLAPLHARPDRLDALGPMGAPFVFARANEVDALEAGLTPLAEMFLAGAKDMVSTVLEGNAAGHEDVFVADLEDALGNGVGGWADELIALTGPWGFEPADITIPVTLFYGEDDNITATHGRALADELGVELRTHAGGHQAWLAVWSELLAFCLPA